MLIGELLSRRARLSPEAPFWEEAGQTWRYGAVERAANRLAHALREERLPPGAVVAICADGGIAYAVAHFAAAKAGLVLAHLHPRSTAIELAWALRHCGAALCLFGAAQRAALEAARSEVPGLARWVCLDEPDAPAWATALGPSAASFGEAEPPPTDALTPESPLQLLYTSGTTGFPKGALISHRAKLRLGMTHALNLALQAADRVWGALPLHHHYAQWLLLTAVPLAGATVVYHPRFEADAAWEALARRGISHLPAVPTTLDRLLAAAPDARPESRAPALRQIVYGGAPCPPGLIRRLRAAFPGVRLFQGFGQTETGYCLGLHDADHDRRPESLGRPDLFGEIRLLDESGHEAPPGEPGEVVARTPYLMTRYWNDPAATTEYFHFGPDWGRTEDLAWRDAEGFYFLAGRKSELIITGGVNVYPAEVERVLLSHPAVREAAVFGTPHADWGEAVTAAVILRPHPPSPLRLRSGQASPPGWRGGARQGGGEGSEDIEASLLDHCRRHLAPFKAPKVLRILDEFPRTASGKVKKKELAKQP